MHQDSFLNLHTIILGLVCLVVHSDDLGSHQWMPGTSKLLNPDIQLLASINRWILSILTFHFDLVHVKGTFHGPDGLLQCPRQPSDVVSEEEDFDFEDWIDNLHGLLHVIQPLAAHCKKAMLSGQIVEEERIEEFSKGKEIPKESEISYRDVPRSTKAEQEDYRLGMVEKWYKDLQRLKGLLDAEYMTFMRYTMVFVLKGQRLWQKNSQGAHQLVIPKECQLYILREVHDKIGHKRFYLTKEIITQ